MDAAAASSTRALCGSSGSGSALFFLLPPCIILFAIDIAFRNSRRPGTSIDSNTAADEEEEEPSISADHPLKGLALKAQEILTNFREAERQKRLNEAFQKHSLSQEIRRHRRTRLARSYSDSVVESVRAAQRNASAFSGALPSLSSCSTSSSRPSSNFSLSSPSSSGTSAASSSSSPISPAFTGLCDRLLHANRAWKRDAEIKNLKRSVKSEKKARGSSAFKSLCDNLLLSNELWKKQREVEQLKEERDRVRRVRVGVATRAAKQIVLDRQKERMIEEFVKDVLKEAETDRKALIDLKERHEKEITEMVAEWQKEQKRTRREIEQLRLAQAAKALEQEMSNELEDRLFEQLRQGSENLDNEEEEEDLVELDQDVQEIDYYPSDVDTYLEEMSTMSSSSTCVGTPSPSPDKRAHFRKCDIYGRRRDSCSSVGSPSPSPRKFERDDYVGFSFNPLFFGDGQVPVSPPPRSRRDSSSGRPTPLRAVWRP
ncbi:hypothetical protein MD484_g1540, partial [Candolleomyces efflorescens]